MATEIEYIIDLREKLSRFKEQMRSGAKYAQCQICRKVVYKGNARKYVDHYGDMRWACLTCVKTGRKE